MGEQSFRYDRVEMDDRPVGQYADGQGQDDRDRRQHAGRQPPGSPSGAPDATALSDEGDNAERGGDKQG